MRKKMGIIRCEEVLFFLVDMQLSIPRIEAGGGNGFPVHYHLDVCRESIIIFHFCMNL